MEKNVKNYESPEMEVIEIEIERAFADSVGTQNPDEGDEGTWLPQH